MSAHQLMRNLDIGQYKSAWFMAHRIRYALTGELPEQINGVIEADETYIGGKRRNRQIINFFPTEVNWFRCQSPTSSARHATER